MYLIKLNEGTKKMILKSGVIAVFILPVIITAMVIANVYFRKSRTSGPSGEYRNQTVQPVDVLQHDSVREDPSANVQTEEKPEQTNQIPVSQKRAESNLLIKFTTGESCKLKITNTDLDEVIDWELAQNDNGTLYLKPGKYSIVATSVIDSARSKTYLFDVKPGLANTTKNLHIRF